MYYKVKEEGRTQTRCVYNILGINKDGRKDVLGMYVSQSEGANFWLGVITDLKQRGLEDILIACIDNLKGFDEAIRTIYPQTEVQTCVVHQIRNSIKYVASKDQKVFMADLKPVYRADNESQALTELDSLKEKWGKKYPMVIGSWEKNWPKLSTYFKYPPAIRRLIYTTNTIEGYHRQIRKVTKNKGVFTSDMALLKLIYLAKGIPDEQAEAIVEELMKDKFKAHDVLVKEELGINAEELKGSAIEAALSSFVLFGIGAVIPVLPFMFTNGMQAIILSTIFSAIGLFLIGAAITIFTGKNVWFSGFRQVFFGLAAAAVTFGIGKLIGVELAG
jgi:VIT1/CCC1 family predicted Fe2+/Mn2+ transporter